MKYLLKSISALLVLFAMLSCNNSEKKPLITKPDEKLNVTESKYSIDTAGTTITWTAYKFTDKVGVKGRFDKFMLSQKTISGSIEDLLEASKIAINTMSVNSGNDIRDPKLKASFFKIFHTDTIRGEILKVNQNEGLLALKMNNITNNIPFTYALKSDTLFLSTTINLKEWDGEEAMNKLNKVCYDLHTGTDGISKLWPDINVNIKLPIKKAKM